MDDERLAELISSFEPPHVGQAEARAVQAANSRACGFRSRPRRKASGVALGLLAAVALAVSPVGQAVAERVTELAGIGERPDVPPFTNPGAEFDSAVIAQGVAPGGEKFDIALTTDFSIRHGGAPVACATTLFPEQLAPPNFSICLNETTRKALARGPKILPSISISPPELSGESGVTVVGSTSPDIEQVTISYPDPETGESVEVDATSGVANLVGVGADSEGVRAPRVFAGFLGRAGLPGLDEAQSSVEASEGRRLTRPEPPESLATGLERIEVSGYGVDGELLASRSFDRREAVQLMTVLEGRAEIERSSPDYAESRNAYYQCYYEAYRRELAAGVEKIKISPGKMRKCADAKP